MSPLPSSPLYRIGGRFPLLETIERIGMTSSVVRARERAIQLLAAAAPQNARILDVPCGSGPLLTDLAVALGTNAQIVGVDASPALLAQAARRTRPYPNIRLEHSAWPTALPEAPFDGAVCCLGLSVMHSWRQALAALTTAVRPGAPIMVIDWLIGPNDSFIRESYIRLGSMLANADPRRPIVSAVSDALVDPQVQAWPNGIYLIAGKTAGSRG
jgi:ubiquinone/menaquinone biosynthesis C-methylase UbiE